MRHLEHIVHVRHTARHTARDAVLRCIVDGRHPSLAIVQVLVERAHHELHHDRRPLACHEPLAKRPEQVWVV